MSRTWDHIFNVFLFIVAYAFYLFIAVNVASVINNYIYSDALLCCFVDNSKIILGFFLCSERNNAAQSRRGCGDERVELFSDITILRNWRLAETEEEFMF